MSDLYYSHPNYWGAITRNKNIIFTYGDQALHSNNVLKIKIGVPTRVKLMWASTPYGGGECHAPLHMECPKHQGHKGNSAMILKTCGAVGERAQVILVWMKTWGVEYVFHPRKLGVMRVRPWTMCRSWARILGCSRTPQSEVWALRYDIWSEALSRDNALEQQWHGSDSRDCQTSSRHIFLDTYYNGAFKVSIGIYVKSKWR